MEFTVEDYEKLINLFEQRIKESDAHIIKARRELTIAEAQHRVWLEALDMLQATIIDNKEIVEAIVAEIVELNNNVTEVEKKYNV